MLIRGRNALNTSFELASELYLDGISLDISKVNDDLEVHRLTDLPLSVEPFKGVSPRDPHSNGASDAPVHVQKFDRSSGSDDG